MRINVSKIPDGGMTLRFEKDEAWFRERVPEAEREGFTVRGIVVEVTARRLRENVFVEGSVAAELGLSCSRCLEPTVLPVRAPFRYTFAPAPVDRPREEWELTAEELDFAYYEGEVIALEEVVCEQILLQIPMRVLCREACRGLCPRCGANLNEGGCGCRDEAGDGRLAVLKTWKVQP